MFCENRLRDSHTLVTVVNEFLPYLPYFLTDLSQIWYTKSQVMMVNSCEFYGNRCSENHTLLKGVNNILATCSAFFAWNKIMFRGS